jgi:hypothetical protein
LLIAAVVKILAIWTALSVPLGLLIAPALARKLRNRSRLPNDAYGIRRRGLVGKPKAAARAGSADIVACRARIVRKIMRCD